MLDPLIEVIPVGRSLLDPKILNTKVFTSEAKFKEFEPHLDAVLTLLVQLEQHLDTVPTLLVQLEPHLDTVPTLLVQLEPHLDTVITLLVQLEILMFRDR